MTLIALISLALLVNLPLGYLRSRSRRFSGQWFLWVHLSLPLIVTCRLLLGFGFAIVPLLLLAAITGQLLGGKIKPQVTPAPTIVSQDDLTD